ncbi:MAG: type IV pilus assembly protein PilM [Parcubacteria group bacterium Gr01-1014_33]|nr:MAG: type IV pilus assembly protein PilM [Parcubacteria group bacterium Gr01-1014_33]
MADISFLKKLRIPKLSLFQSRSSGAVGIDIGTSSTKVVQLRYESERAILQTYGELLNAGYLKKPEAPGTGFLRYLDSDISALVRDVLAGSNVTWREAIFALPATSSFIISIPFPLLSPGEIKDAIPYEARKYIPIPISEVVLSWEILETQRDRDIIEVLLVAVPREVVEKFKRIADGAKIKLQGLEVEPFSVVRALVGRDPTPTGVITMGRQSTNLAIADRGKLTLSHNFSHGSQELTGALERGLSVAGERAELLKRDVGLSEKLEEKEISSIISSLLDGLFGEIERVVAEYNHTHSRKIQKINLTGGGSNLRGIVELAATHFGIEVGRGNPFARLVTPPFMQPTLQEIGSSFSVAVGLALRNMA